MDTKEIRQDRELKAKHRAMWALGDYPALAEEVIGALGPALVRAAGIGAGDTVLDVAAGSGNAAIAAARTGARVVASDLTPELLEVGRRKAESEGVDLEWREADAEELPFPDDSFDAVLSCVGVMFAPHHAAAAAELLRVCRPGGTIALLNWTPEGFIGQMFAAMRPYAPPPPPGVQPPPLWGDHAHVDGLFGEAVTDLTGVRRTLPVPVFTTPESFRDYFKSHYGPTITTYRAISGDPARTAALDEALADLGRRHLAAGPMEWEYLLLIAHKGKP
ncbi:methyltransferase family protein [Actinocorallia herbida]|uniref:Methyltransferase family protein n=1 Tax=Actinocorallia herbida TaxID=58109 RepID=A0A3N1CS03_9ACTN|nr:methyltransferase domain-containing protein [Actinocorallia herbida]ROO83468.1 methyltransferase family protein [Actinocorallia herbida]